MSSNVGASCSNTLTPAEIAKQRVEQRKARRAEAQRKRRQADPELRAREAQRKRQRRRETTTAETRARHAEAQRQRRQANPAVRNADVEAKRRRRQANCAVRNADVEAKRQRRANASAADRRRESNARAERLARQLQRPGFDGADIRFQREFLDWSFGHSCSWFDNDLTEHACCCRKKSTKPVQTENAWPLNTTMDVAAETSRSVDACTQATFVTVKVHRYMQATDVEDSEDSDIPTREFPGLDLKTNLLVRLHTASLVCQVPQLPKRAPELPLHISAKQMSPLVCQVPQLPNSAPELPLHISTKQMNPLVCQVPQLPNSAPELPLHISTKQMNPLVCQVPQLPTRSPELPLHISAKQMRL
ncbi:uncharacterized protein LOC119401926 isoform X5 [Rhipicephalus sanguineus]|uniref:uncharacterized protein LOC119401926 isoform X5 n=1 Tax=Rhipicephalus sanguineus TaxID=34632 RepID=UPI0020C326C2|nr:uncharacterized protein LOC119401926 isoform X5 [Rhipicephalus sanguineus]